MYGECTYMGGAAAERAFFLTCSTGSWRLLKKDGNISMNLWRGCMPNCSTSNVASRATIPSSEWLPGEHLRHAFYILTSSR